MVMKVEGDSAPGRACCKALAAMHTGFLNLVLVLGVSPCEDWAGLITKKTFSPLSSFPL
jgi:hypothetical protein